MLDLCSPPPSQDYGGLFFIVDVSFANSPDIADAVAVGGRLSPASVPCQMAGISWSISKFVSSVIVPASGILCAPDVLICSLYDARSEESNTDLYSMRTEQASIACDLWRAGVSADVFYGTNSLQEQLEFAQSRGVKYVVLVREKDLQIAFCEDPTTGRSGDDDYNVSLRVLVGAKGKQLREQLMKRSDIVQHISHSK